MRLFQAQAEKPEWEFAARGGLAGKPYVWGDDFRPHGKWMANTHQGHFPDKNTGADGFIGSAPVASFAPNGFGLFDMAGNVWQWCEDWYDATETGRVLRGASWYVSNPVDLLASYRGGGFFPDGRYDVVGFRCVVGAESSR